MIELVNTFDLLGSINCFLLERRSSLGFSDSVTLHPRLINQEKGGHIIYTWNDLSEDTKVVGPVTHVGIFDPNTQKNKVLWIYNQKVKIVSCSVNKERTLLAYTIVVKQDAGGEGKPKEVYQAFMSELHIINSRVFSLNLQRPSFLKVQFLYPDLESCESSRDSLLLVFLHKESIGLYKIHMSRIGDRGIMMSGQPKTVQVIRKFVWAQWDVQNQRLYYVQNVHQKFGSQKFSAIQFTGLGKYDNMIDVPINFPFPHIRLPTRSYYADIALYPGIPDVTLNITVLSQNNGTLCFCYQRYIPSAQRNSDPTLVSDEDSEDNIVEVNYYVCMVHHAKTLHGCVSGLPRELVANRRLFFQWFGDYLLVTLPGVFCHFLNVNIEFEPCNHILLHNQSMHQMSKSSTGGSSNISENVGAGVVQISPATQKEDLPTEGVGNAVSIIDQQCLKLSTVLVPCFNFCREAGVLATCLYDTRSGVVWRLMTSPQCLLSSFRSAYWPTKLAILHYLLMLRTRDFSNIRQVFEEITQDPTSPEMNTFMSEFLVGSLFVAIKKQVDKEVFRLLTFTTQDTCRGQFEKNASGERLACISYKVLDSVNICTKASQERGRRPSEDGWDLLRRTLRLKQTPPPTRFCHEHVIKALQDLDNDGSSTKKWAWIKWEADMSFFDGLHTVQLHDIPVIRSGEGGSGRRSKSETILGNTPLFLQAKSSFKTEDKSMIQNVTEQLLMNHLVHHLKKEFCVKAQNVAREYLVSQAKQSQQLCHLLWSIHCEDPAYACDKLLPKLGEIGTDKDYHLFQVFERYYLVTQELTFPRPPGFSSYFTSLGFKCLSLSMFLQYVDRNILQLTPDFILQLLEDLPDRISPDNAFIKFQIISRLPRPFAEDCFRRWNHPYTSNFAASEQVAHVLYEGLSLSRSQVDANSTKLASKNSGTRERDLAMETVTFKPLAVFLKYLEETAQDIRNTNPGSPSLMYDTTLIKAAALALTRSQNSVDLSTVNF